MEPDLSGIHRREKVTPEERHRAERDDHQAAHDQEHVLAVIQRPFQPRRVTIPQLLKAGVEAGVDVPEERAGGRLLVFVLFEQEFDHRRHHRSRKEIGGQHRKYHPHRERLEEKLRHPAQEEDRHEHDADAKGGNKRRHRDLRGPVEDRPHHRLVQGQIAVDVLDLHRRVVHQDSHRQRQPAQGHDIERLPQD